jgi:N-methylhydantoinase A
VPIKRHRAWVVGTARRALRSPAGFETTKLSVAKGVLRVESAVGVRVAADVGGTFIDYVAVNAESGQVRFEKQPAASGNLVEDFMAGLARMRLSGARIEQLFHGATIAINGLLQERGARVGLVTTAGFRDVLELGRGGRRQVYNFRFRPPTPLVPQELRYEVSERLTHTGEVITPLRLEDVEDVAASLKNAAVDAVAVCLLHAYANPVHELEVVRVLRGALDGKAITASHEIASEWHEFERTSSAVVNAYVQPLFAEYMRDLVRALADDGYRARLGIMQSNGGVMPADRAINVPVRTLMSGPAGGVVACRELTRALGIDHAICADVGGTSFDVALVLDGNLVERTETEINGRPVLGATVDIRSIGAGGGSIAWVDDKGSLKVGPASAGATPGPACFGKGGTRPTVTDAQLILGRLDADNFLGGRMRLDRRAAEDAVKAHVADGLGMPVTAAALGIVRIAEANMTNSIRAVTVERGLDPRDFALIAYGGGGGLFAALLAAEMGVTHVIGPTAAANFSAWGILSSDYHEDATRTRIIPVSEDSASAIRSGLTELSEEVTSALIAYNFPASAVRSNFSADVRFVGQHHTVNVPVDRGWLDRPESLITGISNGFRSLHDRMYGPRTHGDVLEIVTLRARGHVTVPKAALPGLVPGTPGYPHGSRQVYFSTSPTLTQRYSRQALAPGQEIPGPAVVEEWDNTTLIPPGWSASVDQTGHLHLTLTVPPAEEQA